MAFIKTIQTKNGITYHIDEYVNGKRRCKKTPARNMKEAKEYLAQYEWERTEMKLPRLLMKDVYFSKLAEEYRVYSSTRKTITTLKKEASNLGILEKEVGDVTLKQINLSRVEALQNKWKKEGLSNKTINNRMILLSAMLRFAVEREYLPFAPKIKHLKVDQLSPKYFTREELDTILASANAMTRNMVIVFINTGMRKEELKQLKLKDIDMNNKIIRIERSKSHRFRSIPINDELYILLKSLIRKKTKNQVFLFELNEGIPVADYYHRFKRLLKRLNIKGCVHQLRHTFATLLVENDASIYDVKELLGHASVSTTQRYAHVKQDKLLKTVNLLCG